MKEIEINPEVLEEKIEKKKKKRSEFNQGSFKGNPRLLFFWMTILMLVWFAFSIVEIALRIVMCLISLGKDRVKNKGLINAVKSIVLPIGYTLGCIIGIFSPNTAVRFLQKIDRLAPHEPPHIFLIIQSLFHKYRR